MKKHFATIILLLSFVKTINAQVIERDSLALVDFYNSMNGPNWGQMPFSPMAFNKWDLTRPVGEWQAVSIKNGRVTGLEFFGAVGVYGSLPESLSNLDSLSGFYVFDNCIFSFPASFANLKHMAGLQIKGSYCGPHETFPNKILDLTNLRFLDLSLNFLTSEIPAAIGNLQKLGSLYLADNLFSGNIPSSFNNLINLKYLNLGLSLPGYTGGLHGGLENIQGQNFERLYIYGNYFNFTGIETLVKKNSIADFWYSPQQPINLLSINGRLAAPAGGTVANNTYKWYKEGSGLVATIAGDSTFQPDSLGSYHAEITNSIATELTLTSIPLAASSVALNTCSLQPSLNLNSNVSGSSYQWQQSTDSVTYSNKTNNTNFDGTSSSMLTLKNIPPSWYGRRYRCVTNNGNSIIFTLTFSNSWTGSVNTNWSNSGNWSCGNIPDANTDVVISSGTVVIDSDVTVRSLTVKTGANVAVNPGINLTVIHQ